MAGANRERYLLKSERAPSSIPLVISPQYTVTERSLKNESVVRNKMCKVVSGPMQVVVKACPNLVGEVSGEKVCELVNDHFHYH